MLGIADRSKILDLLNSIFEGKQKESVDQLREMINQGIDPKNFLNDLLEIIYFIQQKKNLGKIETELSISESEKNSINLISEKVNMSVLIVYWQFILKVIEELSIISNPILSLEMLIIRLVHLKEMPSYEDVIDSLKTNNSNEINENSKIIEQANIKKKKTKNENDLVNISKDQIKNMIQTKPISSTLEPKNFEKVLSFEDLIFLSSKKREVQLKYDLENNVNLIKFSEGKIDITFNQNLDKSFVRNLSERLYEWTGNRWVITLSKTMGQKTFSEIQNIKKEELLRKEKEGEINKKFKKIFSDGELIEVKKGG